MEINSITIFGFRGFNLEQTLMIHNKITLVYAPNSYGKTSISEALEWLIYGITSKVEKADSKDEYKGSYRNRHLPEDLTPFVAVAFSDNSSQTILKAELLKGDEINRYVDGTSVNEWPFAVALRDSPKPFILQHALKYLLLTKPDERFQGFARLLGLDDLDNIHKDLIAFCTKPEARLDPLITKLRSDVSSLESRLAAQPALSAISKSLKKGIPALSQTFALIKQESIKRVPPDTKDESVLPQLLKIREDAVAKIFKGRLILTDFTDEEKRLNVDNERQILGVFTDKFTSEYLELARLSTVQHIIDKAKFFDLGMTLLNSDRDKCPFCGRAIDDHLKSHIVEHHTQITSQRNGFSTLENRRIAVSKTLSDLANIVQSFHKRHDSKALSFLSIENQKDQLETIIGQKYPPHFDAVCDGLRRVSASQEKLLSSLKAMFHAIEVLQNTIELSKEDSGFIRDAGNALSAYMQDARDFQVILTEVAPSISDADQVLKHELDSLAGTQDISLLIELYEEIRNIEKKLEIDKILESLKDLRKTVDQFVANRMFKAISSELTSEVMDWYSQIKTTGDPDVHFGGFDLERTAKGDLKARRVQIKAISYGKELVSAVSSLSESKLNALGLCVSIATNLKSPSPFDFILIDDPIQSWDAEHEIQFIEVIRRLVILGKQVIVLSHNKRWLDQVRKGCRSLNGLYYEITGYTQSGPHFCATPWEKWAERLNEVDAILKDPDASSVKLQQAEEEIRLVVPELASLIYEKKTHVKKSPHDLNSSKTRKMLVEAGVPTDLVDRVIQTFETTDDAHHPSVDYAAQKERIRRYYNWSHELSHYI